MRFVRGFAALALLFPLAAWAHAQGGAAGAADAAPTPVVLTVTVADRKLGYVAGLARESFVVYEEKAEREVLAASAEVVPVSLGLVFDVSGSIMYNGAGLTDETRRAFLELAKRGGGGNEYFVMGFGAEPRVVADWTRDPARVADGLNALPALQGTKAARGTALYDALSAGLEKAGAGSHARRALLVVSDGWDGGSRRKFAEVRRLAAEGGVLVYALILVGYNQTGDAVDGQRRVAELCGLTGGWADWVEVHSYMNPVGRAAAAERVKRAMEALAVELRSQYAVSFRPSEGPAQDAWRRVEVKVRFPQTPNKLSPARSREGYLARAKTR